MQNKKQDAELQALQQELEMQLSKRTAQATEESEVSARATRALSEAAQRLTDKQAEYSAQAEAHAVALRDKSDTIIGLELELASVSDQLEVMRMAHSFDRSKLATAQVRHALLALLLIPNRACFTWSHGGPRRRIKAWEISPWYRLCTALCWFS